MTYIPIRSTYRYTFRWHTASMCNYYDNSRNRAGTRISHLQSTTYQHHQQFILKKQVP
jgi:hypothetical protein